MRQIHLLGLTLILGMVSLPLFADYASTSNAPGTNAPPITPGIKGKSIGDVIAPQFDNEIAAYCDFSKQIFMTRTGILCVYNGKGN